MFPFFINGRKKGLIRIKCCHFPHFDLYMACPASESRDEIPEDFPAQGIAAPMARKSTGSETVSH